MTIETTEPLQGPTAAATTTSRVNIEEIRARPADERIAFIRRGAWIGHPRAQAALEELRYVLTQPPSSRMTGLTLNGPTNNGKSSLIRAFITSATSGATATGAVRREFLHVDAPPTPSQSALWSEILRQAGDLKPEKGTTTSKQERVLHILPQIQLRMLFIDEIHNVLAGSQKQAEAFLNALKYLSNRLRIPIVLVGTEAAVHVLRTDPQVLNRYPSFSLPAWPYGDDYLSLVRRVLRTFPLRSSPEITINAMRDLHAMTEGAIGALVQVLRRAAVRAIETGAEKIVDADIERARR